MRNRQFRNREDLENELIQFLSYQTQDFYKNGIFQLVSRWEKVILAEGDSFSE